MFLTKKRHLKDIADISKELESIKDELIALKVFIDVLQKDIKFLKKV